MTIPTTAELLKYADLQMAAEAFLRVNKTGDLIPSGTALIDALKAGNGHSSKFTKPQAEEFAKHWTVLDQRANTSTGFSGTLFQNKDTNEIVMSFRSTEFIDDSARDNQATNAMEIKETGFAWGQIRDMQAWYKELTASGGPLGAGQSFAVTGYSLGGHLATAFNTMYAAAKETFTFNGAGIGGVDTTTNLKALIDRFTVLTAETPETAFTFEDSTLAALYARALGRIGSGLSL